MRKKEIKDDNKDIKVLLILIFAVAIVTIMSTYAWLSYRTNDTAMVLTVGDINGLTVTLKPYQINGSIAPVSAYSSGKVINITADNNNIVSDSFSLYYQIESIDPALKNAYFKYTVTKSTDNGSNYTVVGNGNFLNAQANSNLDIYADTVPAGNKYLYKVYLWIDTAGGNQSTMQGKKMKGDLRATITH